MVAGDPTGQPAEEIKVTSILAQLSSAVGDRTNAANHAVAQACLADPHLLADVAEGLLSDNQRLAGDCGEVMTQTASLAPENVAPYADVLLSLLDQHYKTGMTADEIDKACRSVGFYSEPSNRDDIERPDLAGE